MPSTTMPNEWNVELGNIERQRKYAEMLRQQGMEPLKSETAGGYTVPIHPLQGLAKMLQTYAGVKVDESATKRGHALAEQMRTDRQKDYETLFQGMGKPPQTSVPGTPEVTGASAAPPNQALPGQINPASFLQLRTPEARRLAEELWKKQVPTADALLRESGSKERHGTPSASALLSDKTARRGQDIGVNPEIQARVTGAKTVAKEQGEAEAAIKMDPIKAAHSAKKILDAVKYNPVNKTDDISNLIEKSTSGFLQNMTSLGIGAVTGSATTGREAIGKLGTEASRITMDLMGGKLGSGISNADRDFVLAQLGDVGNANIPANERLAAWQSAMQRLIVLSGGERRRTTEPSTEPPPGAVERVD